MSNPKTNLEILGDTLKVIGISADLLNNKNVKNAAKIAVNVRDLKNVGQSITSVTGQSHIISRIFVDEAAVEETVYPGLVKHLHDWYAAQILAALNLAKLITSKVSVQDTFSIIQDGRRDRVASYTDSLLRDVAGVESFLGNYKGEAAVESMKSYGPQLMDVTTADRLAVRNQELEDQNDKLKAPFRNASVNMKSVKASENKMGPMGELFEITLTNPTDKEASVKTHVFIQMQPSVIPAHVAPRFIDLNVVPTLWQRWTQWRAGEIGFFQDFIGKKDLMDRKMAVVKDPSAAHAMTQFLSTITKKDKYALGDVGAHKVNKRSANLANSVVIFTEQTVAQAKADSAVDLHDETTRNNYFRDTYTMAIAIVDTMHQRVTLYFNGIDGELNCSYNEFKPTSKSDSSDFLNALTAFSTNSIGRLR